MDRFEDEMRRLAPTGYYLALRVGFAFPLEQVNALPADWIETYTRNRYLLFDPVIRWCYHNNGACRWSELNEDDPQGILDQARSFGLAYGVAVAVLDEEDDGQRSFGYFTRDDREFDDDEIEKMLAHVARLHAAHRPPTSLTAAELEALRMVKDGMRLKQIAHHLGVTEGAVKLRLRSAKAKLHAATSTQAATLASGFGLI